MARWGGGGGGGGGEHKRVKGSILRYSDPILPRTLHAANIPGVLSVHAS